MQKFVERMIEERKDLVGKIKKAENAIANNPFGVDKEDIELLTNQVKAMKEYLVWLEKRLGKEGVKFE